jgi:NADH:ubiquinone oxidoreductase subunit E
MTKKKHEISVCMGSSCFSRGNRSLIEFIQEYLAEHHLEDQFFLKGHLCLEKCRKGPVMTVNGTLHSELTQEKVEDILNSLLIPENQGLSSD